MWRLDLVVVAVMFHLTRVLVGGYKIFHKILIMCLSPILKPLIIRKLASIGITVNGKKPWDIRVLNDRFYQRLANERSLGMGESYMDGDWDVEDLEQLTSKLLKGGLFTWQLYPWHRFMHWIEFDLFNLQTPSRAYQVAKEHYDLRPELFTSFLDKTMTYTCAYWKNANTLEQAQIDKMDLVARKLKLKPGMRVLELGCGWGGLAHFLASRYNVKVVAVNIAKEGAKSAKERCKGLPVEVRCMDYRGINEKFDRVVIVGMLEHVGNHNYRDLFKLVHRCLDDGGIFVLHTIGQDSYNLPRTEAWYDKYVFPNGRLPYPEDITKCAKELFVLEDWHNFGIDYALTLKAWNDLYVKNWPTIEHLFPDSKKFARMWTYYLLSGAGCYTARVAGLWQMVFCKNGGYPGGYVSER